MQRSLDELLDSQQKMLEQLKKQGASLDRKSLARTYFKETEQLNRMLQSRDRFELLPINHSDCILDPHTVAQKLSNFLPFDLPVEDMASQVDPTLYRRRKNTKAPE